MGGAPSERGSERIPGPICRVSRRKIFSKNELGTKRKEFEELRVKNEFLKNVKNKGKKKK